jgi:hypothetical protein
MAILIAYPRLFDALAGVNKNPAFGSQIKKAYLQWIEQLHKEIDYLERK